MRRVIVESPYAGRGDWFLPRWIDRWQNILYARKCLKDSLCRGESPIAFHLLHTLYGVLRDRIPNERMLGIAAGMAWMEKADASIFYLDRGMSPGMVHGEHMASDAGVIREYRRIA